MPPPEERLNDNDRQIMAASQLGELLHLYRVKAGFIRLFWGVSVVLDLMAVLGLALLFWDVSGHGSLVPVLHTDTYAPSLLDEAPIFMIFLTALVGAFFANITASGLPHNRVMIFEHGLFLRRYHVWKRYTEVLR